MHYLLLGIDLKEKTPLETACFKILGNDFGQFYTILSHLLILNPQFVMKNDSRLSAKISSLFFNDDIQDKVHLICLLLENDKLDQIFTQSDIDYTKLLLDIDPELSSTNKIISYLKSLSGHKYSEIVQKVPIKHKRKPVVRIFSSHYHIDEQQLRKFRNMKVNKE